MTPTIEDGLAHHRAGRLKQAAAAYRRVLEVEADNPDALHLLGVVAHQSGDHETAIGLIGKAIGADPSNAGYHSNLGEVYRAAGRIDDSLAACRKAIELDAGYAEAHHNLGLALLGAGRRDEALAALRRAVAVKPGYGDAWLNLARTLEPAGDHAGAAEAYRRRIALGKAEAAVHHDLGKALKELGDLDGAIAAYRDALDLSPDYAEAWNNLGVALADQDRFDDAIAAYRRTIELSPGFRAAHNNLGIALKELGRLDEAHAAISHIVGLDPGYAFGHTNLGNVLRQMGRVSESARAYRRSIELDPGLAMAHNNLAMALLLQGDFEDGLAEYEWRWKTEPFKPREYRQPAWDGGEFAGKTLLLYAEQGLGDAIQFIRYAPDIVALGGKVIVECPKPLARLFEGIAGLTPWLPGEAPQPAFDLHAPLLSLPWLFATRADSIPAAVPYLAAPEAGTWRERVGADEGVKVGLVWAGRKEHSNDRNRSIPLDMLRPLLDVPGARVFSLQVGGQGADIAAAGLADALPDLSPHIADFADTAGALGALDLLISVDTAPVHLAGALGRPVWVMLPFVPDWRWLLGRADSPWYPTLRLFRQGAPGDWGPVIEAVRGDLAALAGGERSVLEPEPWTGAPVLDVEPAA